MSYPEHDATVAPRKTVSFSVNKSRPTSQIHLRQGASPTDQREPVSIIKTKSGIQRPTSQIELRNEASTTDQRKPASKLTRTCKCFLCMMTLLLFAGAVAMVILYVEKQEKVAEKDLATVDIRKSLIHYNQSFEGKNDIEILEGAQQLVQQLSDLKKRNEALQKSIDSTIGKLTEGWKQFKGRLYYFSEMQMLVTDAWISCIQRGSLLVIIKSDEEEDFIEEVTSKDIAPYWIGLEYVGDRWLWKDMTPLEKDYWMDGKPDSHAGLPEHCVEIHNCTTRRKCWNDVTCSGHRKWICKAEPEQRWL